MGCQIVDSMTFSRVQSTPPLAPPLRWEGNLGRDGLGASVCSKTSYKEGMPILTHPPRAPVPVTRAMTLASVPSITINGKYNLQDNIKPTNLFTYL